MRLPNPSLSLTASLLSALALPLTNAYRVRIQDTDELREVCSGMYGGKNAYISLTFDPSSIGQLALVMYEWNDVKYLGADTPYDDELPKTYICTTSAIRSGLCHKNHLGSFIVSLPEDKTISDTSIFSSGLRFGEEGFPQAGSGGEPEYEGERPGQEEGEEEQEEEPTPTTYRKHRPGHQATGVPVPVPIDEEDSELPNDVEEGELPEDGYEGQKGSGNTDLSGSYGDEAEGNEDALAELEELEEELKEAEEEAEKEAEEENEIFEELADAGAGNFERSRAKRGVSAGPEAQAKINAAREKLFPKRGGNALDRIRFGRPAAVMHKRKLAQNMDKLKRLEELRRRKAQETESEEELQEELEEELEELEAELGEGNSNGIEGLPNIIPLGGEESDGAAEEYSSEAQEGSISEGQEEEGSGEPIEEGGYDEEPGEVEEGGDGSDGEPTYEGGDGKAGMIEAPETTEDGEVPVYDGSIIYPVRKTGYYCVGVVPVTLVNSKKRNIIPLSTLAPPAKLKKRQSTTVATHAEYAGEVIFRNSFDGELPAAEYPKIAFYLFLSTVYALIAGGWGFLCVKYYRELLPMQWYITGTIGFLVIEMLANFGYYRYINKHGGGASSLAFLFVVAILNAGRNSISFFLLLIVSMGLSVVTPSLGAVMNRVRLLTIAHFIFGVLYAIGSVRVELETASLFVVLFLIFPLALTLTAFLMWTIISLNGTIVHLQNRNQRHKLSIFKKLYRILMVAVIAIAAFFVISSLSLSNRLEEDYAPRNWRYRWILLDASLAFIYLGVFGALAWLWRPSENNVRFAMSQEIAQDEGEAEDYEFGNLSNRPVQAGDEDEDEDERGGLMGQPPGYDENGRREGGIRLGGEDRLKDENVVFALEDDDEDAVGDIGRNGREGKGKGDYRDMEEDDYGRKGKYD